MEQKAGKRKSKTSNNGARSAGGPRRSPSRTITALDGSFGSRSPRGFRSEEGRLPAGGSLRPFRTEAEVKKHIRLTILGPQCKVIQGGEWDPNWAQRLRSLRTDLRISVSSWTVPCS